jgi:hypothetical protein
MAKLQRLEPLRRELSDELLSEVQKKSEKSYHCLACLDSGEVQTWLIQSHEIIPGYRSSDVPLLCRCGARPRYEPEYLDWRLTEETCTALHEIEVERWKEAIAPPPRVVRQSIADMVARRTLEPIELESQLEAINAELADPILRQEAIKFIQRSDFFELDESGLAVLKAGSRKERKLAQALGVDYDF